MVVGASFSGKSTFTKRLIENRMFEPFPERIVWCYGIYQPLYDEMLTLGVEFIEGFPSELYETLDSSKSTLIVIDDLMDEVQDNKTLTKFFTKGCHHKNVTIIFILQNLFPQGKHCRTISLNTQYIVVFKNTRDKSQINCLGKQMFPGRSKYFQEAYLDATKARGGYLFLDLKPDTPDDWRVRTNIFPTEDTVVYASK
jgi:GTPase SAR1 family protein